MPVGGDVTQFSLGLMAVLARSVRAARLPIWNDLWGYGFPGLAESQMGVYYPPHLLLYGLLPLEIAYTTSLVAHTLWAGLGAFWAARKFGISAVGSALAGFAWAACGFFVIHVPHQWGYTTGSWMPWAWGLAWLLASGRGTRRTPLLLALVLTLQVLPGHFQLAFYTEVGVLLIGLAGLAVPGLRRGGAIRGVAAIALALLAVAPLGALQLVPTWRLARLAAAQRDYEYLSGFASTPVHLVSYVSPYLFHISPLWRPVAWDPFRTSPEENLAYVGLVPLFLALATMRREARREPAVRVLAIVALVTLALSLGPYIPGFSWLIRLPGFSFFRAPARWGLAVDLALCLLAGRGFDLLRTWPRPGRALRRFALVVALLPCLLIGWIELALATTERSGAPELEGYLQIVARWVLPAESRGLSLTRWMEKARQRQSDLRVASTLARQGLRQFPPRGLSLAGERRSIYLRELAPQAMLAALLVAIAALGDRRRSLEAALIALAAGDLWLLGRQRPIDFGPIRSLTAQSPVLARLARERGVRVIDPARNLTMLSGAAPVDVYHTLDLPTMKGVTLYASYPPGGFDALESRMLAALRATGASLRILDQFHMSSARARTVHDVPGWDGREELSDSALAGWLFGKDWVAGEGSEAALFTLWRPWETGTRAWLIPLTSPRAAAILKPTASDDDVLAICGLGSTVPLETRSARPERLDVAVELEPGTAASAVVLVSQLAEPQWRAHWIGIDGRTLPAAIQAVRTNAREWGWQAVKVPGPGRWTLRLEYVARDVQVGLIVSGVSFLVLAGLGIFLRPGNRALKVDQL
jgi:hypothetical protein